MDWGRQGAAAIGEGAGYAIIADVLSFTTTLSVAADRGAQVFPYRWQDSSARAFARRHDAVLAVGRSQQGAAAAQSAVSLSPASVRAAGSLRRLVLPSPNGSALATELGASDAVVIGGCLRNRWAVASWLASQIPRRDRQPAIAVVAAGERWADGSLRAAVEDLWGAGAVISALAALGMAGLSPEDRTAAAAFEAVQPMLAAELLASSSGRGLADAGFGQDVAIAAELDASTSVPVLADGRFTDVSHD